MPTPDFKRFIRNWPDNPRSDLTHLLAQPHLFPALVSAMTRPFRNGEISHVATMDAGGFPLGGAVAVHPHAGVVLIRKVGRINWAVESVRCIDFSGTEKQLEITADAVGLSSIAPSAGFNIWTRFTQG